MSRVLNIFSLILVILASLGCNRPDPDPELKDPIYLDISSELKALEGAIKTAEKEVDKKKKDLKKLPPGDPNIRQQAALLFGDEKKLLILRQQASFLKIQQEKRRDHVRAVYPEYFEQKKPWPDEKEFERYKKIKELRVGPKSWEERRKQREKIDQKGKESSPSH